MNDLKTTQKNLSRLMDMPIRGHKYEFSVGNPRKDGKVAVLVKDIVKVTNGNQSYFSRSSPAKTFQVCESVLSANQVVKECVYVILRRAGFTQDQAVS
jgi:hypothetical protein